MFLWSSSIPLACARSLLQRTLLAVLLCVGYGHSGFAKADSALLDQVLTTNDARHLFSRTGFGYSLEQHDQVIGVTRRTAIKRIMLGFKAQPSIAMPAWVNADAPYFWSKRHFNPAERIRFERDRDQELAQLRQWWVSEMLQTPSPQTERLVLFWHDIMATSYHGVDFQSLAMARQNAMFREYGLGQFGDLLKALIRDAAMLNYLDNENSRKQSPNENLARELLERFSMGEGNYSEADVKAAARALTGYGVSHDYNMNFQFESWKHDTGNKTLFGQSGKFDGDDVVDLILEQEATAEFVATRFWQLLIADKTPSNQQIQALARQLQSDGYDMANLYRSILESPEFWAEQNRVARVKSPITLQIGIARALDYPKRYWQSIAATSAGLGMSLFAPPNVSGWDEGTAFTTAGRLKQRKNILESLLGLDGTSNAPGGAAGAGNMMQAVPADKSMAANMMDDSGLVMTLAAEDYHGPVLYRLELRSQGNTLWKSATRHLANGHDTARFGRVNDMSNMPWQQLKVLPPAEFQAQADTARLFFLNDDAGQDGDKNLYVRGIAMDGSWYPASVGTQHSACTPKNPANAGNLYCNGYIDIPLNQSANLNAAATAAYQVGNARVRWGKVGKRKKNKRLELTLEAVQTPQQRWRNITVSLHTKRFSGTDLRLSSFSCWPDCFETAGECVWLDKIDNKTRTWSFPLSGGQQCHYESLAKPEQQLVDAIWMSLPELLDHARELENSGRFAPVIDQWQQHLKKQQPELNASRYANSKNRFVFNETLLARPRQPEAIPAPLSFVDSQQQLHVELSKRGLTVFDLLLPGLPLDAFPQLLATRSKPLNQQLGAYNQHSISQLY